MKNVLAIIGAGVFILWFAAAVGVGNFVLIYSPDVYNCKVMK